jgi:hypothetical protein
MIYGCTCVMPHVRLDPSSGVFAGITSLGIATPIPPMGDQAGWKLKSITGRLNQAGLSHLQAQQHASGLENKCCQYPMASLSIPAMTPKGVGDKPDLSQSA